MGGGPETLEGRWGKGWGERKRQLRSAVYGGHSSTELLLFPLCPHAPHSACLEGRLNCMDLPCPGTYQTWREVRRSGQGPREGWDWRRDGCAPVPAAVPLSAWQLVPVVGMAACSQPCRGQMKTRSRACACPSL